MMDCTCAILSVCVLINIVLIMLVAFQEERSFKDYHVTGSKDDFELLSEHFERFKDSFYSLEVGAQRLNNEISNSKEDLQTVYVHLSKHLLDSSVKSSAVEEHILEVNLKFSQLNSKFDEVKDFINEIKKDFQGIEMSLYMLELQPYMGNHEQRTEQLKGELGLDGSTIVESNDYNEDRHPGEIDEPINFGSLFNDPFFHEDLSGKSESIDSEELNSNEPVSHTKTFRHPGEIDEPINFGSLFNDPFFHEDLSGKSESIDSEESNSNEPVSHTKTFRHPGEIDEPINFGSLFNDPFFHEDLSGKSESIDSEESNSNEPVSHTKTFRHPGEIDEPINFGSLFNDPFFHEDLSGKSESIDSEESNSNEPVSHTKTFQLYTEQVSWAEAVKKCELGGLQLVSIRSPAEQQEIVDVIQAADLGPEDFWTSGHDLDQPGIFVWASIGRLVTYSNWIPGEPNYELAPALREQEHCLSLVHDLGYRWDISVCSERKYFVCEERRSRNE